MNTLLSVLFKFCTTKSLLKSKPSHVVPLYNIMLLEFAEDLD